MKLAILLLLRCSLCFRKYYYSYDSKYIPQKKKYISNSTLVEQNYKQVINFIFNNNFDKYDVDTDDFAVNTQNNAVIPHRDNEAIFRSLHLLHEPTIYFARYNKPKNMDATAFKLKRTIGGPKKPIIEDPIKHAWDFFNMNPITYEDMMYFKPVNTNPVLSAMKDDKKLFAGVTKFVWYNPNEAPPPSTIPLILNSWYDLN